MSALTAITSLSNGARFYRADLHIHSFGGSHDVTDSTATPEAIVRTSIAEKLDVIAVTDHNEIENVAALLAATMGTSLLAIPAVELSTPSGHLLCYLPNIELLQKLMGRVTIVDRKTNKSRCQTSILECLEILGGLGGFGVLAHVDGPGGFETENPGNSPHKIDVFCHKALLGVELKTGTSPVMYSDADQDPDRRGVSVERIKRLGLGAKQFLARVLNSDAHSLAALGRNAQGDRKITRIKMAAPSFEALKIAFDDSDARVRIEELIPTSIPYVEAIHIEGGFLDGQQVHLSKNLNCIIGGRGTGKSTAFEAIRCLTGQPSPSQVVDSEVWPTTLRLFWRDQAGQSHQLIRSINGEVQNVDNPQSGPCSFHIESYGQGETARISKEAHDNPLALLSYLDRFVDLSEATAEESGARDELLALQSELEVASKNVDRIPQAEQELSVVTQQLSALEKAKAKDVIELQRRIATERQLRLSIVDKVREIKLKVDSQSAKATVDELIGLADPKELAVGAGQFEKIIMGAQEFVKCATAAQAQAQGGYEKLRVEIESQIATWKTNEASAVAQIDSKRKALEAQNIRLDMAYIEKLAKDEARLKADVTNLKTWRPHLVGLKAKYAAARSKRWTARDRMATLREGFAKNTSEVLKHALSDLMVSLKFERSSYSPDMESQITAAMGWRTIQVPRAALLVSRLTASGLLEAVDKKNTAAIVSIKSAEGASVFAATDANQIIERLGQPAVRFGLERAEVYDLPRLTVTKMVPDGAAGRRAVIREFAKLSLGQQQSTLLALMLSSKSNAPLIIDQPEDNLDGEFIYHSLVPVLRLAKERRQIVIVTHNANIAVLGDAEQIIVLKSTSEKALITSRGSIDDSQTRAEACSILEGAREAFLRRSRIYGAA